MVGFSGLRLEDERVAKTGCGFNEFSASQESTPEVVLGAVTVRFAPDGLANQRHGKLVPPCLMGYDAEHVERFRMVGLDREDLTVEGLGFRQSSGLVVLEGVLKSLLNRHGLVYFPRLAAGACVIGGTLRRPLRRFVSGLVVFSYTVCSCRA